MNRINKDTQLCMSISARPSNFGTRFHNYLYDALKLNFVYKAFAVSDIEGAVRAIRALNIRGCAVSMPHKEAVMPFLDEIEPTAQRLGAINTIVNTDGVLKAYNTDLIAVRELLSRVPAVRSVALLGSGGMARAVAQAVEERGLPGVTLFARNTETGREIATKHGFEYAREMPSEARFDLLVNITPIGMHPDPANRLPFTEAQVSAATAVIDVVANPSETALVRLARAQGKSVITGLDVVALQAVEQFRLYTGVTPTPEQVRAAAEVARV